jgi:hypothetical protein
MGGKAWQSRAVHIMEPGSREEYACVAGFLFCLLYSIQAPSLWDNIIRFLPFGISRKIPSQT